jgi:hypothetical protein
MDGHGHDLVQSQGEFSFVHLCTTVIFHFLGLAELRQDAITNSIL